MADRCDEIKIVSWTAISNQFWIEVMNQKRVQLGMGEKAIELIDTIEFEYIYKAEFMSYI
jgi:hypothetical protein